METNVKQKFYRSMLASMFSVSLTTASLCGFADQCTAQSVKKITPDPYYSTLRQSTMPPKQTQAAPSPSFYQSAWEPPRTASSSTPAGQAKIEDADRAAEVWSSVARKTTKPVTRIDFSRLDLTPPTKADVAFPQATVPSVTQTPPTHSQALVKAVAQQLPQSLKPASVAGAVAKAANEFKAQAQALTPIKAINKITSAATQAPNNAREAIKSATAQTRSIIRQKDQGIFTAQNAKKAVTAPASAARKVNETPQANLTPPTKAKPLTPWKSPSEFNLPRVSSKLSTASSAVTPAAATDDNAQPLFSQASKIAAKGDERSFVQQAAFQPQLGKNLKKVGTKIKTLAGTNREAAASPKMRIADASNNYYQPGTTYTPQGEIYSQPMQSDGVYDQEYDQDYYQGESFENSRVLALVGGHPVFVGDMMFEVNQILEKYMKGAPQSAKDAQKSKLMARLLPKYVDQKILYVSTLDQLPEEADINDILKQAEKTFNDKALPDLMENSGVESPAKFDAILRSQGTSVRQMRRAWAKDQISKFFLQEKVKFNRQVTHLEMLDEYRSNYDQYAVKGKVRWEQIEIQPAKAGGRFAAKDKIEDIYDRLVHGGNFEAIAKKESHGFRAFKGGQYDWTGKGSLVNKEIDKSIFTLPQGKLSGVIETKAGFHIIRVIERVEDHHTPFTEAQVEIKKRLLEARRDEAFRTYIDGLKDKINVEYLNE